MSEWLTAHALIHTNNWLTEGGWNLRFGLFHTPASVENPTLDDRVYYGSYPPGAIIPLYFLLKVLSVFEPNVLEDREKQLMVVIVYNYIYHFLLALFMCFTVYLLLARIGFDNLNATILATTPAIFQFSNAHSLYWYHLIYSFDQAVLLPYVLFIFLELLRKPRVPMKAVTTMQALLIFYGVLTDWLFVFVICTVYIARILNGHVSLPASWHKTVCFFKQSFLFFLPAVLAVSFWLYQVIYFSKYEVFTDRLSSRMGLDIPSFSPYLYALKTAMFTWMGLGYGLSGAILIYATFYFVARRGLVSIRARKTSEYQVIGFYLLFFIPCFLHLLFFIHHSWEHVFSALKFSLALSVSFVVLPVVVLKSKGMASFFYVKIGKTKFPIYVATVVGLVSSIAYGYVQISDATKFFTRPDHGFTKVGRFIREYTDYSDVVFSSSYIAPIAPPQMQSLTGKVIHPATNLDQVYQVVKDIKDDFMITIFYFSDKEDREIKVLAKFLVENKISITSSGEESTGSLLSFSGREFVNWYDKLRDSI